MVIFFPDGNESYPDARDGKESHPKQSPPNSPLGERPLLTHALYKTSQGNAGKGFTGGGDICTRESTILVPNLGQPRGV
jgi:hypothetical protein